jgi:hypothetical protein
MTVRFQWKRKMNAFLFNKLIAFLAVVSTG